MKLLYQTVLSFVISSIGFHAIGQVDHWETVVYEDDNWKYLVPTVAVSDTWIDISFDDVTWTTSPGGFGMGDGDDNTVLAAGTLSVFQRIHFNITDLAAVESMVFDIDYDDGFVAYINGQEICRSEMFGTGIPPFDQTASGLHEAQIYQGLYPFQQVLDQTFVSTYLNGGDNILCVQTHNQSTGSSDISSRVWLTLGINNTSADYGPIPAWFIPPVDLSSSNLPIVVIETGGVSIPDEPKISATMGIIHNGEGLTNSITDPFNEFYGQIGIEVRGSSSGGFAMKSYGLETQGPSPEINYNVSLFDWPVDNDWILYAPYNDKALLRNVLTYKLGSEMGNYSPRTKMCEVIINGEYQGVYVFMERIKQSPGRVDIDELLPADDSGNELTGGYILKVDKTTGGDAVSWTSPYTCASPGTGPIEIILHEPKWDSLSTVQKNYIRNYFTDWEDALAGPDFADPTLGYAPYIDELSFIDFMLSNEISKNVDGYRISTFLYKERESDGGDLVAGPLWDFNLAWGNADYCEGGLTTGWELDFNSVCGGGGGLQNPFWWNRLLQDPNFAHATNCRWQELRQDILHTDSILYWIDTMAVFLDDAQQRNYTKWPILGVYLWPNNFVGATYAEEITYFKDWITQRMIWMDANMFGSCADLGFVEEQNEFLILPNPAGEYLTLQFLSAESGQFSITNLSGSTVLSGMFSGSSFDVRTTDLPSGFYVAQVTTAEGAIYQSKFIKR